MFLHSQQVKIFLSSCAALPYDAIIYREKGVLQTRRPDRVMMKDGEVIVVDFKFGKKRKTYNKQVKEYMDLLSDMGYEHIRGYLWYVFNNELEEIE